MYSERRHRLNGLEVGPVKEAVRADLMRRLAERDDLLTASILFRFWYRISTHCMNKPRYPLHETWRQMEAHINGTVNEKGGER